MSTRASLAAAGAAVAALSTFALTGTASADDNSQRIACETAETCIPVHVDAPVTVPVDLHDGLNVFAPIANDLH